MTQGRWIQMPRQVWSGLRDGCGDAITRPGPAPSEQRSPAALAGRLNGGRSLCQSMVGITKSAPARMPVGQRVVMVFSFV